ncbi:hypothetical protein D1Y85_22140 [Paraburkholderia dinghuensis]|uniref:Uncharacterized protein n=1 Tax=Paraburkholderia dinghuensis TaxID=2305225 RepID=A0A3N6ML74_9BURK|nr:hypothetical protein D1Y85_22140 [Paraburkholderia dinghuensis]
MASSATFDPTFVSTRGAADDDIRNSTRSTDFISPKSRTSRLLRDAVLNLAETDFAGSYRNGGSCVPRSR